MAHIVNPFRKVTCPYCHESYYPGECRIIAKRKYQKWNPGDVIQEANSNIFSRTLFDPLISKEYVLMGAVRVCPKCDSELPLDPNVKSYIIAIVGDVNSGKSHYLASCLHQLFQDSALRVIGCSAVLGLGNTDKIFYSEYYVPSTMNKMPLHATMRAVVPEPLIYELVFPDKRVNLVFYDTSGSDFIDPEALAQFSGYLFNASAMIFLADPMSMPGFIAALPAHLKLRSLSSLTSAQVLSRVIHTFKQGLGISLGKTVKIPIAITISKSDLLEFVLSGVNTPSYLRKDNLPNAIDITQFTVINQEVQDFLTHFGDPILLQVSKMFETVSFFAVSATGWPQDVNGNFPSIEPRRCLDPLLWILWKLGVIAAE